MPLIQDVDYRLNGYHKKQTFDAKGDLVIVEYYQNYDEQSKQFSNLKVRESRTYTRNATTTLLEKRVINIEWFKGNDEKYAEKTITKFYDAQEGYQGNKRARRNLINKASMYLLNEVGLENGKTFLDGVGSKITVYVDGSIQPLLDAIANSSEPYMTPTIKGTLDTILNVTYTA